MLVGELNLMLSKPEGLTATKEILDDLRFLGVGTHHMSDVSADFLGQLYEARNDFYEQAACSVFCRLLMHCSACLLRLLAGIFPLHRRVILATLTPCCWQISLTGRTERLLICVLCRCERHAGGNTIGQVFTPRFLTTLMAKIAGVTLQDVVFDPCAGTGGFLIAAAHQAQQHADVSWPYAINELKDNLWGFESERVTAALCVVNMVRRNARFACHVRRMRCWSELLATQILRGDGKSRVFNKSCLDDAEFPTGRATLVLMNPPFPHDKKKSKSVEAFIDRGLEGLQDGGRLLSVVPDNVLFGAGKVR